MSVNRFIVQNQFSRWARTSTPRGREVVLDILKSSYPAPIRTQDIYQRVREEYPDEKVPFPLPDLAPIQSRYPAVRETKKKKGRLQKAPPDPPHPDHPIRYLKSVVLEELAQRQLIAKVHTVREPTAEELAHKAERPSKRKKKNKTATGPTVVINARGMIDQWGWTLKTTEDLDAEKKEHSRIQKAIEGQKLLDTKKLEGKKRKQFEENWGHLNVRRRRARSGKLDREEQWAHLLEGERQEGRIQAQQGQ